MREPAAVGGHYRAKPYDVGPYPLQHDVESDPEIQNALQRQVRRGNDGEEENVGG